MVLNNVTRRKCWYTKQQQIMSHVMHSDRVKFPEDFFSLFFFAPTWRQWRGRTCNPYSLLEVMVNLTGREGKRTLRDAY